MNNNDYTARRMSICFLLGFCLCIVSSTAVIAQTENPVKWSYELKGLGNDKYEIRMKASIPNGWHIYAQKQPVNAICEPTSFRFIKNPLLKLQGTVKEIGKMKLATYKDIGASMNEYYSDVVFVQVFSRPKKAKTRLSGEITFMACTEEYCLAAETTSFSLVIE